MPTIPTYHTIILGAGAAGLMCAIETGKRGRHTLLLDHAKKPGEKIRISGGGRCNFTNLNASPAQYLSQNPHFCVSALRRYTQHDFLALVQKHRIAYHEKTGHEKTGPEHTEGAQRLATKGERRPRAAKSDSSERNNREAVYKTGLGQLFCDGSSQQIIDMLLAECEAAHVELRLQTSVTSVTKPDSHFHLETTLGPLRCESLVLATGGLSIPKMGATGFAYDLARQFGLNLIPTAPGLVPFTLSPDMLATYGPLSGIATDSIASCGPQSFREAMLFTHRGLSGPAILQISSYWQPGQPITLNLAPNHDLHTLLRTARDQNSKQEPVTILAQIFPKRLAQLLATGLPFRLAECSTARLNTLADSIHRWQFTPHGTEGYRTAEVTLGGIDTRELSSKTMESTRVPGLYCIGESVDVTGWLGGYNFQWAWSSGFAAGQHA